MKEQSLVYVILLASWLTWPVCSIPLPVTYDQRQEGMLNFHAQLENVIVVLLPAAVLPQLVKQLSKAESFKEGTTSTLLKGISSSNIFDKKKSIEIIRRDGQKHLSTLPNFPSINITNIPDDPNEPSSSSARIPQETEFISSSPEHNKDTEEKDLAISDSKSSRILTTDSPTNALQQKELVSVNSS